MSLSGAITYFVIYAGALGTAAAIMFVLRAVKLI
ncbi:MAG: cytochrome b6-f complex subunit PetL [Microcoleaceae cyanobacterium]|jgi:hypothetical protein